MKYEAFPSKCKICGAMGQMKRTTIEAGEPFPLNAHEYGLGLPQAPFPVSETPYQMVDVHCSVNAEHDTKGWWAL